MDVAFYFLHFFSFLRDTKYLRFNIFNFSSALKWFCVSKSGVCSFVFVGLSEPLSFNTSICLIVSKMICMIPSVLCLLVRLYEFGWRLFVIVVDFSPGSVELRLTYGKNGLAFNQIGERVLSNQFFPSCTEFRYKKTEIIFAQAISRQKESQWISRSYYVTLSLPTISIDDDNKIDIARNFSHRQKNDLKFHAYQYAIHKHQIQIFVCCWIGFRIKLICG